MIRKSLSPGTRFRYTGGCEFRGREAVAVDAKTDDPPLPPDAFPAGFKAHPECDTECVEVSHPEETAAPPADAGHLTALPTNSAARKGIPLCTGVLDYFTAALAEVARVSYLGNEKHNPGQPLHWSRGKSMDHADCILRHLAERGGFDGGIRHSAALAWRALALLQEELEAEGLAPQPRGAWVDK